jgi:hypothetical protein
MTDSAVSAQHEAGIGRTANANRQQPRKSLGQSGDEALTALIAMKGLNRTTVYSGSKRQVLNL